LKASFIEILKLAKPNNIVKKNLLFSDNKIDSEIIKLSFFIFISFFISIAVLSSILLTDSINFENSFKLSILTLTNTVNSNLYGIENLNFANLLTSSKLFIIIFMIIAKIELISIVILIKKLFLKN
jgi:trk system potassium uptake protein TrkH